MNHPSCTTLSACAVGEIGRLLASAEMLRHGIGVSRTELDCGVDLISHFGRVTKLIQVKTKSCETYGTSRRSETFKIRRKTNTYEDSNIDVFLFISLVTNSFYVVPVSAIDLCKTSVSLPRDSEWKSAWHILKAGERHA